MKNCDIVKDLILLYEEGLLSDGSKDFVRDHIKDCKGCEKLLKEDDIDIKVDQKPLDFISKRLEKEKRFFAVAIIFFLISLWSLVSFVFNKPLHFEDDGSLFDVYEAEDMYFVKFDDRVTRLNLLDTGDSVYVDAYTTRYDKYFTKDKEEKIISFNKDDNKRILYDNHEKAPSLVVGKGPVRETLLPRLALGYYNLLAIAIAIGLFIIILIIEKIRKKKISRLIKVGLLGLPLAYLLASLVVKGFSSASHYIEFDFKYIILLTLGIYLFFLSIALFKRQRSMKKI